MVPFFPGSSGMLTGKQSQGPWCGSRARIPVCRFSLSAERVAVLRRRGCWKEFTRHRVSGKVLKAVFLTPSRFGQAPLRLPTLR